MKNTKTAIEVMVKAIWPNMPLMGPQWTAEIIEYIEANGFVIVPIEPTEEMWAAAKPHIDSESSNTAFWQAMLKARPR